MKVRVGNINDLPEGIMMRFEYEDKDILLANVNGKIYAVSNICTHAGANLHEGKLDGNKITCPWHNAVWDVTNGNLIKFPVQLKQLQKYEVVIEGNSIYLLI